MSILPFSFASNHDNWVLFCGFADDTVVVVKDILAYYRIHNNNTCGLAEFKRKRPLIKRIAEFDKKGKESIIKQFVWYSDTADYLNGRTIESEQVLRASHFFTDFRIKALGKNKITGTVDLIKAYNADVYKMDGIIVFMHDLFYLWLHTKRNRKALLQTVTCYTRRGATSA